VDRHHANALSKSHARHVEEERREAVEMKKKQDALNEKKRQQLFKEQEEEEARLDAEEAQVAKAAKEERAREKAETMYSALEKIHETVQKEEQKEKQERHRVSVDETMKTMKSISRSPQNLELTELAQSMRQLPTSNEGWSFACQQDWSTCVEDEAEMEYFPWVCILFCSQKGEVVGLGSVQHLTPVEVTRFIASSAHQPVDGAMRRPEVVSFDSDNVHLDQELVTAVNMALAPQKIRATLSKVPIEQQEMLAQVCEHQESQNVTEHMMRQCLHCEKAVSSAPGVSARCRGCLAVYYCSPKCQKADWKKNHKQACPRMKLQARRKQFMLESLPFPFAPHLMGELTRAAWVKWLIKQGVHNRGAWRRESGSFKKIAYGLLEEEGCVNTIWDAMHISVPYPEKSKKSSQKIASWSDYYTARGLKLENPASLLLHFVLTLYHIIVTAKLDGKNRLRVHYLGPEKELDSLQLFGELAWLLPKIEIEILLIGPGVPRELDGAEEEHGQAGDVRTKLLRGFYHDVAESKEPCDLVVGLNAGLAAYPSFKETTRLLVSKAGRGTTVFCSDINEESAYLASQELIMAGGTLAVKNLEEIVVNPFRCPRSEQGATKGFAIPSFGNGFLFSLDTGKHSG